LRFGWPRSSSFAPRSHSQLLPLAAQMRRQFSIDVLEDVDGGRLAAGMERAESFGFPLR
jgi:hypothetical protein